MKIIKYLILLLGLGQIAWIDGQSRLISNRSIKILLGIRGLLLFAACGLNRGSGKEEVMQSIAGMVMIGGLFLLFYFLTNRAIGAGDIKLLAVIGAYVGSEETIRIAFLAAVYGCVWNVGKVLRHPCGLKENVPFAPCIFCGTLTVFFRMLTGA